MTLLFWAATALVAYVYVGYPLLVGAWAALRPRPWRRSVSSLPAVSIVVAARDEAARLPGRLDNLLALDYPPDRLEIIVVSDGSADRTDLVMSSYVARRGAALPRVRFVERPADGKAAALNTGVALARHEVLIFADARQRFARGALRSLVASFDDPAVGVVSGELMLDCEAGDSASSAADSIGAYWRYEKWIRAHEAAVGSMLGATGAIYAMRRGAWRALPPGAILDDVLAPMRAVAAGWRTVVEPAARAFDVTAPDTAAERRRKTRTLAGNWQLLALEPGLLLPWTNPAWFQFLSHKVGRLLVPFALVAMFVSSAALAPGSPLFQVAFGAQAVFYAFAAYGAWLEAHRASRRREGARDRGTVVNA
jgi:cellulose synthase/poly-beta-1,6-N-acetylglucosamine synthase-like glycosyltransferase